MVKKVIVPKGFPEVGQKILTDAGLEVVEAISIPDALTKAPDAQGILAGTTTFKNDDIAKFENLKIIARSGVGYNNIDVDFAASRGIWVTITPNANASTVAETTLADILAVSKNIFNDSMAMRKGDHKYPRNHPGFDLANKTLGIIGFGRIGQMLAKKASQLDMRIIYNNRTKKANDYATYVEREELIKQSDIICLTLAVTPQTERSFGQREFEMMKSSAYLINTARGQLVDPNAMLHALQSKQIAGAALDVFDDEPLPLDSPLYQLDNVLLTPHIAANTVESMTRMITGAAGELVTTLVDNKQPQWPVNQVK
ncbi:phosphoglycerate dehydrogenase [Lentilactobacillus laojiaonis]|uniref:phosphoglycerate dehydrogenase n=1 Tax=Lentilactobacillus laojiaonis TaxID=2883998 RepID=UPI001D0ACC46|nr:phosphoglycerate dehydrogenase [Lentilactobacillus laojiaonis]UDM32235.1 phosphoglycerate dehydrogenase [Lentilactobacillus laojiaonis]